MPVEPPQTGPGRCVAFPGRTLPILTLAYKGDAFDPENRDYVAARLLAELAFGPQSDLNKELVLRRQTVEMLGCDVPLNRDPSLFTITAMVKQIEDVDGVRQAIANKLEQFKTRPVDRQKLDDLKRRQRVWVPDGPRCPGQRGYGPDTLRRAHRRHRRGRPVVCRLRPGHAGRDHARRGQVFRAPTPDRSALDGRGRRRQSHRSRPSGGYAGKRAAR